MTISVALKYELKSAIHLILGILFETLLDSLY